MENNKNKKSDTWAQVGIAAGIVGAIAGAAYLIYDNYAKRNQAEAYQQAQQQYRQQQYQFQQWDNEAEMRSVCSDTSYTSFVSETLSVNSTTCSICLYNIKSSDINIQLPCSHIFHEKCLEDWTNRNKTCPNCRADL